MAKVNHHSLKYKRMSLPNKKYKELKAKQKSKLAQWMFWEVCSYYKETDAGETVTLSDHERAELERTVIIAELKGVIFLNPDSYNEYVRRLFFVP